MKPVDPTDDKGFSLRRWSQRKAAARAAARPSAGREESAHPSRPADVAGPPIARTPVAEPTSGAHDSVDLRDNVAYARPVSTPALDAPAREDSPVPSPLPPIESLGIESDFTAFMQPGVDESLKRGALKKLFSDPRFNMMDGLDVYIDDYSKPDPIDPAIVRTLSQARYIFNPPATRVTAEGYVEDVPEEELRTAEQDARTDAEAAPETVAQEAAAALPGAEPQDAAISSVAHDVAIPATKAKPEA
jgi:hypothetical protein